MPFARASNSPYQPISKPSRRFWWTRLEPIDSSMDPAIDTARGIATSTLASQSQMTRDGDARTRPNPENAAFTEDMTLYFLKGSETQTKNANVARRSWSQIIHFEAHLRAGSFD